MINPVVEDESGKRFEILNTFDIKGRRAETVIQIITGFEDQKDEIQRLERELSEAQNKLEELEEAIEELFFKFCTSNKVCLDSEEMLELLELKFEKLV